MSRVLVLTGGVGGAKLALGLYRVLPPDALTVVVNTGDDFDHCGLRICPDLDTSLYTLAGLANREQGWGREDESWHCLQALTELGGDSWFQLGDRDLALHLLRTQRLGAGDSLSDVTRDLAQRLGIAARLLPMSDQSVATELDTDRGRLTFQEYFVRRHCEPAVRALHYVGADQSRPAPAVLEALARPELEAIVIAPSNPWLSVAPLLSVPGMVEAIRGARAPVVAVSPVIGGSAVKGPTTKIMAELQLTPSAATVAGFYKDLIDGFVVDRADEGLLPELPVPAISTATLMVSLDDRERLAREVLAFARQLQENL